MLPIRPQIVSAIIDLVHGADVLFIEAAFAKSDADLAAERAHLTTKAAGEIARAADVRRVEPFHFSPRYEGQEESSLPRSWTPSQALEAAS